jgi:hypothetical protein
MGAVVTDPPPRLGRFRPETRRAPLGCRGRHRLGARGVLGTDGGIAGLAISSGICPSIGRRRDAGNCLHRFSPSWVRLAACQRTWRRVAGVSRHSAARRGRADARDRALHKSAIYFASAKCDFKRLPTVCRLISPQTQLAALMDHHWDTIECCVPSSTILAQLAESGFARRNLDCSSTAHNVITVDLTFGLQGRRGSGPALMPGRIVVGAGGDPAAIDRHVHCDVVRAG